MIELNNGSQLANGEAKVRSYCQQKKAWPATGHVMGTTFSEDRMMRVKVYSVGEGGLLEVMKRMFFFALEVLGLGVEALKWGR